MSHYDNSRKCSRSTGPCAELVAPVINPVRTGGIGVSVRVIRLNRLWVAGLCLVLAYGLLLCGAASEAGAELVGPLTWHSPVLIDSPGPGMPGFRGLRAISCPSASLCVAVDAAGDIITSADPAGGAGTWSVAHVDGNTESCGSPAAPCQVPFRGVSCTSASWCVAWDAAGFLFTSTAPTLGAAGWRETKVVGAGGYRFDAYSCPSASLCVAVGYSGEVLTSTNPAGGPGAWHPAMIDSGPCPPDASPGAPTGLLCHDKVAGTGSSGPRWLLAISCPSVSLCVAGDAEGDVLTSTDPTGGSGAWNVVYVDHEIESGAATGHENQAELIGIACPSVSLCMASDGAGNVLTSENPTGGATAWTPTKVIPFESAPPTALEDLSCPSTTLCLGLYRGKLNYADVNYDAFGGGSWNPVGIGGGEASPGGATGVSCPSSQLCVAIDEEGDVIIGEAHPLSTSRIKILLRTAVKSRGRPSVRSLLRRGSISIPFTPPIEGLLRIRWLTARTAKHPHSRQLRLASGQYDFLTLANQTLQLRLTKLGRKLLREHNRLAMTAEITLSPRESKPITATEAFVLRR